MIIIESKRKKIENILKKHPNAIFADVTSQAKDGCWSTGQCILLNGYARQVKQKRLSCWTTIPAAMLTRRQSLSLTPTSSRLMQKGSIHLMTSSFQRKQKRTKKTQRSSFRCLTKQYIQWKRKVIGKPIKPS